MIPIIDIFAGPGGLGEGFSSLLDEDQERIFRIGLSIEKDPHAHQTLKLRSFFRQFPPGDAPEDYYAFVRGEISISDLYEMHPIQAKAAGEEACCATLGPPDIGDLNGISNKEVDERIRIILGDRRDWLLIGGPPCQAYSLVGRSRRQERMLNEATDKRVGLYKEYLRIIAAHKPAVFVMENVKGLLSAKTENEGIFQRILVDLSDPVSACITEGETFAGQDERTRYRIYSLVNPPRGMDIYGHPIFRPNDFVIKAEDYGVPQRRHRVILLGIRDDVPPPQGVLQRQPKVALEDVIGELPALRSGMTRSYTHTTIIKDKEGKPKKKRHYQKVIDSAQGWAEQISSFAQDIDVILGTETAPDQVLPVAIGLEFSALAENTPKDLIGLKRWYHDARLGGILHHVSRKHLVEDLKRYLFASRFLIANGSFPRLEDYRKAGNDLLPNHDNAGSGKFTDRFRVQPPEIPATTITSHISKDGHYFIHYDPAQCRTFTVREAARVQTFPDNYYFCGGRTQQFHQVGNAVPPYLARQIAAVVSEIFVAYELLNLQEHGIVEDI